MAAAHKTVSVTPAQLVCNTVCEASTAHITKADSELLSADCARHPQLVMPYGGGFLVSTWIHSVDDLHEHVKELIKYGHSASYVNLIKLAVRQGSRFLQIDVDGTFYDWLPQHDWLEGSRVQPKKEA